MKPSPADVADEAGVSATPMTPPSGPAIDSPHRPAHADPPALWMNNAGVIVECTPALAKLLGYSGPELVSQHVSVVLPQLSPAYAFRDGGLNPMLGFLCHLGHPFQARTRNGSAFGAKLYFVENGQQGQRAIRLLLLPQDKAEQPARPSTALRHAEVKAYNDP